MKISIYETTLRDGMQGEGMHLSVDDELVVAKLLDDMGVAHIEGGWPGSNPRDAEFFVKAKGLSFKNARLAAFGATRRSGISCEKDASLQALLKAEVPTVTLVGKGSRFQAEHALGISTAENLALISDTIRYMKSHVDEVIFDAEHFFDGYKDDTSYAIAVLRAAAEAGADWLVLCDTNGGTMTDVLGEAVAAVKQNFDTPIGIHTHNDADLAVANSIDAVVNGATMVQGTINGYGERCGNANLISIIAGLELKKGIVCLPEGKLANLTHVSRTMDEILNLTPRRNQPYVGGSAFAHKGGIHASAMMKNSKTYEHVQPEKVGNRNRFLVSDMSGKASVVMKARQFGIELEQNDPAIPIILDRLKTLESQGYQFEAADASFKLLVDEAKQRRPSYFKLHDIDIRVDVADLAKDKADVFSKLESRSEARIKLEIGGVFAETRSSGIGPVQAIDLALRKLIDKFYPSLKNVELLDYRVRVLSSKEGTGSVVRVLIRSGDDKESWGTVGVSQNIIEASWRAMVDALEYQLVRDGVEPYV
jgi:2-isopropylmalate synthase